ncbi:hypothetical protein KC326_g186 [Hortaea werneckii]|nr:hypothetical protein KC326_g186 [Hortaea werneckii]
MNSSPSSACQYCSADFTFCRPLEPSRFGLKWRSRSKLTSCLSFGLLMIRCISSSARDSAVIGGTMVARSWVVLVSPGRKGSKT